jgi:MshEN domain
VSDIDVYKEWLGIADEQRPPDYYTLLRLVQFEDDVSRIQANYRKLNTHVRKYATGQYLVESQELLNELAKAMLCLTDPDGKREYDESQGRESAAQPDETPATVLEYLVSNGHIDRNQVSEIEHFSEARGLSHRDAVIQMKLVKPPDAVKALAAELRMSFVDLDDMLPEDDVLDKVPRRTVKRHACLPLFEDRGRLLVACSDEPDPELEDELRMRFGIPMRAVLALPRSINQAIAKYYAPGVRDEATDSGSPDEASGQKKNSAAKTKGGKPKRQRSAQLTDAEKAERMKISLIIICWSIIGPMAACYFLNGQEMAGWHYLLGIGMGAIAFGLLKLSYWKS